MIRAMTQADVTPLSHLFQKGRRQTFHWVEPSQFALADFAEQTRGERVWVAEQGGSPCGFIAVWAPERFVHHLYVSADWHGQGVGRALLERALAELPRPVSLKVAVHNTTAIAFYRRLGWEPTEEMGLCEVTGPWRRLCLY
ncbi:GNAT family N-acetyltransferase [Aeromonas bivalvium]|uniref:GNAT family N-acetyltransferase n=1 Tax=Aeromonas bivalvium TaxID=440079 RepID=UPI0038D1A6B4